MKRIAVRLEDDVWAACLHRMIDEDTTWQALVGDFLEAYGAGKEIKMPGHVRPGVKQSHM